MKTIFSILILSLTLSAQAKTYPTPISWVFVRSVPVILTSIVEGALPAFWAALAAKGAVDVLVEMTEPLENHGAAVKHVVGATSAEQSWPDWEYPTRELDAERTYDFDPFTNTETWWIKSTWTEKYKDGTSVSTITYSQTPPPLKSFRMEDIKYRRIGLSGAHQTSFSYDAYEKVVVCAWRKASSAWPRPLTVLTTGFYFDVVFRSDIKYEIPTLGYEDRHYVLLGPASSGQGAMAQWKPHWQDGTNVEIFQVGFVTLLSPL
jgi:hypothetical protein